MAFCVLYQQQICGYFLLLNVKLMIFLSEPGSSNLSHRCIDAFVDSILLTINLQESVSACISDQY